ncbi:hypothetical protein BJY01DRAFT_241176 [Aspergillus pseudoustus]|uniref:FAD dependent oxidoreductase domain-containing protein n=1 Tax=Aspergillus pseudoustus TaxID=1810923 RepID=A0ABR4IHT0_9EURO
MSLPQFMPSQATKPKTIAIIGGGWSGCHTAVELAAAGHQVTILEKGADIFNGVSGQFGIRIHRGPHYPRSSGTRKSCRRTFDRFTEKYRELVVPVNPAIYSLARYDSMGKESKVSAHAFGTVCRETEPCSAADVGEFVRENSSESQVECAYKLDEPCALLNLYLKTYFQQKRSAAGVGLRVNTEVISVKRHEGQKKHCVSMAHTHEFYDAVINATGYTSALPESLLTNLPINADIRYQACIALHYTDSKSDPNIAPLSFIVMDWWFPCLMPSVGEPGSRGEYVLTHGAYTILGSFDTPARATQCLTEMTRELMEGEIKPKIESEMERFWPSFKDQFVYQEWKGTVLPKTVTESEISNVLEAADEVFELLEGQSVTSHAGYAYARDSELNRSKREIEKRPVSKERNTCFLQTHQTLAVKT